MASLPPRSGKAASRPGRALWFGTAARLALVLALVCLLGFPAGAAGAPLKRLAVFPFTSQRGQEREQRLAEFLQTEIVRSLSRWGRVAVLSAETASLWQRKLGLRGMDSPNAEQLKQMGVQAALHGTVQQVAGLALIKMRLSGASGNLLGGIATQQFELASKKPRALLNDVLLDVFPALYGGDALSSGAQPVNWNRLWRYQGLRAQQLPPDADENHNLLRALRALEVSDPDPLAGRLALTRARLMLEHGVLNANDGRKRHRFLKLALTHAKRATLEEPWNARALALKGEIHYFLRQEFESRTEASVARVKNPLSALAYAVLGLAAGLSTGEASVNLRKAVALDPFLRAANRPQGTPAFQNGVLEPLFVRWEQLLANRDKTKAGQENLLINRAIALFKEKKWPEAEQALIEAAQSDEYSHLPELYLARIQIETGDSRGAVERLAPLTVEFPQEAEVYYHYGVALENTKAYAEAMDAFQKMLVEKPGDERGLFHLGTSAMERGDWSRALDALRLLLSRNDQHAEGWLNYGMVNAQSEQWQAADDAFQRALRLKPGWEEAQRWRDRMKRRIRRKR